MTTRHTTFDSPLGKITVVADGDALTGCIFPTTGTGPLRLK